MEAYPEHTAADGLSLGNAREITDKLANVLQGPQLAISKTNQAWGTVLINLL